MGESQFQVQMIHLTGRVEGVGATYILGAVFTHGVRKTVRHYRAEIVRNLISRAPHVRPEDIQAISSALDLARKEGREPTWQNDKIHLKVSEFAMTFPVGMEEEKFHQLVLEAYRGIRPEDESR